MLATTQQMNAILNKEITTDDCRVCLSSNKNNKFIYSTTITNEYNNCEVELKEILQLHGGIELAENDGLPSCICQECFFKVHTANKLWKQCQLTDRKLQAIYQKPEKKLSEFNSQVAMVEPYQTEDSTQFLTDGTTDEHSDGVIINENILTKLSANMSNIESTQIQNEDADAKDNRWANRPRRVSMFKRMTSMKNLTDNKERQRNHMKSNKNPTPKSDNLMNDENSDNIAMKTEDKIKLSRQYQCSQCDEKYSSKKSLYRHCLTHDEETNQNSCNDKSTTPPSCNICTKVFRKTTTMIKHLNIHKKTHPTDVYNILKEMRTKKESECLSDKTSRSNISRKSHKKSRAKRENADQTKHNSPQNSPDLKTTIKLINTWIKEELSSVKTNSISKIKEYSCSVCGKFYMTKKTLLKHHHDQHERKIDKIRFKKMKENNVMTIDNQSNEYRCNECDKTFNKELLFQRHMKMHENKEKLSADANFKRFLCHICSKTFRQNTGLMFHMRTHTGYKPHECKFCGRGFTSNSNCINHERTHTGDRPFVCHFCSAAFAKSCTLKSHITTHTGEANYHCKTCGKSFRRLKYLKEHKFTHTGEKPYACKICGTAYSHSGSLFVHEKKCKAQLNNYQPTTTTNAIDPSIYSKTDDGTIVAEFNNPFDAAVANENYDQNVQDTNGASEVCNNIIQLSVNIPMTENAIQGLPIPNQIFNS